MILGQLILVIPGIESGPRDPMITSVFGLRMVVA